MKFSDFFFYLVFMKFGGLCMLLVSTKHKLFTFYAGVGNISAAMLFPVLMYNLRLGVSGAALATVASQYAL